ncbi:hypothetical protein CYMTET_38017 [Cymbomonas tetramitiformis]|uniref:RRM domain-containing protein n=1 Tax=Cymbomonas tetramitiformis TaxID=36881 RepID=A0AAE0CCX3_9CHLO|nr:hypothetical protein CYMTET_38017 [Cymbomonas tetramitiformis]|eukprot:gene3901-4862_t
MEQQPPPDGSEDKDCKTLWVGDLPYWVEEQYLWSGFAHTGEVVSVKLIRNKATGRSEGYGFCEFANHFAAEKALRVYNGMTMPGVEQTWRLNWAAFGAGSGPEFSVFVGDLAPDVNDYVLQETFRVHFPSVRSAKVVTDPATGRTKGYGFVRFGDEAERDRALTQMNGQYCSSRPMRISLATAKKHSVPATPAAAPAPAAPTGHGDGSAEADLHNTTVFVGGLDPNINEQQLRSIFTPYGELIYVKIPQGKGCGFVQFTTRQNAEIAISRLHNTVIGSQAVRLSWGRSPTNKPAGQPAAPPHAAAYAPYPAPGYYGAYPGYYDPAAYDPAAYAAAYDPAAYAAAANPHDPYHAYYAAAQADTSAAAAAPPQPAEENLDPTVPVDVAALNAAYIAVHQVTGYGQNEWFQADPIAGVAQ